MPPEIERIPPDFTGEVPLKPKRKNTEQTMKAKATGAEWKKFYSDTDPAFWPEGAWHDDEEISVNGVALLPGADLGAVADNDQLTIQGGVVFLIENDSDGPSLVAHFIKWRKKQSTTFMTVEVPHEKAVAVKAAIVAAGGKVK